MTIKEIIERLIEWHQPYENPKTRDTVKSGNINQECTGIALCCWASMDVIEKAAALGCNLLISHESLYYGDEFDLAQFAGITAYENKKRFLEEHNIAVFRDHDHMHGKGKPWVPERVRNDYIYYGFMKVMGWDDYVIGDQMKPTDYIIPEMTGGQLADLLIEKLQLHGIRMVGDPETAVTKVHMIEHCLGKGDDARILEAVRADALIPLEMVDWTAAAYVRDAVAAGQHKIILQPGHFNVEEAGMMYMEKWLPDVIDHTVPVTYIRAEDPFLYRLAGK